MHIRLHAELLNCPPKPTEEMIFMALAYRVGPSDWGLEYCCFIDDRQQNSTYSESFRCVTCQLINIRDDKMKQCN